MGSNCCKKGKDDRKSVSPASSYKKVIETNFLSSNPLTYKEEIDEFLWSNNSKSFTANKDGWRSLISSRQLPEHFSVSIKVIELRGVDNCSNGGIGVTTQSTITPKSCIGNKDTEYAIMPQYKGGCFIYGGKNNNPINYGKEYKNGDIITIIYGKNKSLSFVINNENQGVAFENIKGPFYLMASLFFSGSQLDILGVSPIH